MAQGSPQWRRVATALCWMVSLMPNSAGAGFCPGVFSSVKSVATVNASVTGQPSTILVATRYDPLSLFGAAITAIALSDGLQYPARLVVEPVAPPSAIFPAVFPADVSSTLMLSGLDVDDHLAAAGYPPYNTRQTFSLLGSLGPTFRVGLFAPAYTVANLTAFLEPKLVVSADLGLPSDATGKATIALMNATYSAIIGGRILVLNQPRSLAAQVLCNPGAHPILTFAGVGVAGVALPASPSILGAVGLNASVNCSSSFASLHELEVSVSAMVQAQQHFVVLAWEPWALGTALGLVRLPLPEYDALSFMNSRYSDFPLTAGVPKTAWLDFEDAYPPSVVSFMRALVVSPTEATAALSAARAGAYIRVVNSTYSEVTPLPTFNLSARADFVEALSPNASVPVAGIGGPLVAEIPYASNVLAAACKWLAAHESDVLKWGAKVVVDFISPTQGYTSGFEVVRIVGSGFPLTPLTAYASIGGQPCLSTRWVDSTVLECVTPQGIGQNLDVIVTLGLQTVTLPGAFSYLPASVRAVASVDSSRSQNAGTEVVVTGANFYRGPTLLCKFSGGTQGDRAVSASFINFTALACLPPATFSGSLTLSVTNDGVRFSAGITLHTDALRFADGLQFAPPDFGPLLAPPDVTIALLLNSDALGRDLSAYFEALVRSTAENLKTSGKLLPYTNVSIVVYPVRSPASSAPDQGEAGAVLQAQQYADQQADLYLRVRVANPNLIAIVGPEQSVAAAPIQAAMVNYSATYPPVAAISYAASSPSLGTRVSYPNFLRVVPSDLTQARALAEVLVRMHPVFIKNGALPANASAPSVHVVLASDYDGALSVFSAFQTFLASLGGSLARVATVKSRDSAPAIAASMTSAGISTTAGGSVSRLVFVVGGSEFVIRVIQAAATLGITGRGASARVFVGLQPFADAVTANPPVLGSAATLSLAISPGSGAHATTVAAASTAMGPFIYDAIGAIMKPLDGLIRQVKSRDLRAYSAAALVEIIRSQPHPEAISPYAGFSSESNDPQYGVYSILNTMALSGIAALATRADVSAVIGTVVPGTLVSLNASTPAYLSYGPDATYDAPKLLTVLVPFPLPVDVVNTPATSDNPTAPLDYLARMVNYTSAWTRVTVNTYSSSGSVLGSKSVVSGLPRVYVGTAVDAVNVTYDAAAQGTFPSTPSVAQPFTLVDPDDAARPLGDQVALFHPSSLFWPALEDLVDQANAQSAALGVAGSPLAGATVRLYAVPYFLVNTGDPSGAHANLAASLHDALYALHVNATPNVLGVLGMHTTRGTKALAAAIAAFPGTAAGVQFVDNTVIAKLSSLPIVSYGATSSDLSSPATPAYRNLVRVVPPLYKEAYALVDLCRRARWSAVGVIYSGLDDTLFDEGEVGSGPELYSAFMQEASRQGVRVLASVNVSNYLSISTAPQDPYKNSKYTALSQVGPTSYASDREGGLFSELLAMRRAGVRVIVMLATRRGLCPVMRAAWAAGMYVAAPSSPYDSVVDYTTALARIAALRDNKDLTSDVVTVDVTNPNTTAAAMAAAVVSSANWALGSDGLYHAPPRAADTYTWVMASPAATSAVGSCLSQLPPDPWAFRAADLQGEIQGYARPAGREADNNIRRLTYDGYDRLSALDVNGTYLFGSVGVAPSIGSPTQVLALLTRVVARLQAPSGNSSRLLLTDSLLRTGPFTGLEARVRALLKASDNGQNSLTDAEYRTLAAFVASPASVPFPATVLDAWLAASYGTLPEDLPALLDAWRDRYGTLTLGGNGAPTAQDLVAVPATTQAVAMSKASTASIYNYADFAAPTAASQAAVVAATSQFLLTPQVAHARTGLRALLLAAAGAIADSQTLSDPDVIAAYLRGRVPVRGPITAAPLAGDLRDVAIAPGTNDPLSPQFDIINRQGGLANTLVRVGTVTDRGYVRFLGCPPGSEPDGEFACRECPVNSWKRESGSQPCSSCPYAAKSRTRMITFGKTGSTDQSQCKCPIGFYVLNAATDPTDPGTICVPCVRSMQCNTVHLLLTQVRNTPGFWRGDAHSPYFFPCLKDAQCNVSSLTAPRALSKSFEATAMNGTACTGNTEGPLCGVCAAGFGRNSKGLCDACPTGISVLLSVAFACVLAIVLVCLLAAVQVAVSPSFIAWRRVNNTKLLINFLQVNAVLLSLNLDWPPVVRQYFNVSQLAASVNLSWVAWECVLSYSPIPVSIQVFSLYMISPLILVLVSTAVVMASRLCASRLCAKRATLEDIQKGDAKAAAPGALPGGVLKKGLPPGSAKAAAADDGGAGDDGTSPKARPGSGGPSQHATVAVGAAEAAAHDAENADPEFARRARAEEDALPETAAAAALGGKVKSIKDLLRAGAEGALLVDDDEEDEGKGKGTGGAAAADKAAGASSKPDGAVAVAVAPAGADGAEKPAPKFQGLRPPKLNLGGGFAKFTTTVADIGRGAAAGAAAATAAAGGERGVSEPPVSRAASVVSRRAGDFSARSSVVSGHPSAAPGRSRAASEAMSSARYAEGIGPLDSISQAGGNSTARSGGNASGSGASASAAPGAGGIAGAVELTPAGVPMGADGLPLTGSRLTADAETGEARESVLTSDARKDDGGLGARFSRSDAATGRGCASKCSFTCDVLWATLGIGLFLLYPTLLREVLAMVDCTFVGPTSFAPAANSLTLGDIPSVYVNGSGSILSSYVPTARSYLREDMSMRCDGALYGLFRPLGQVFAVFYVLGIPLLFFCVLGAGRTGLHLGRGRVRIGGRAYKHLAYRLREVAGWVQPQHRLRLYRTFGGCHVPVAVRLRNVFDVLHSPFNAQQSVQLWRNEKIIAVEQRAIAAQRAAEAAAAAAAKKRNKAALAAKRAAEAQAAAVALAAGKSSGGGGAGKGSGGGGGGAARGGRAGGSTAGGTPGASTRDAAASEAGFASRGGGSVAARSASGAARGGSRVGAGTPARGLASAQSSAGIGASAAGDDGGYDGPDGGGDPAAYRAGGRFGQAEAGPGRIGGAYNSGAPYGGGGEGGSSSASAVGLYEDADSASASASASASGSATDRRSSSGGRFRADSDELSYTAATRAAEAAVKAAESGRRLRVGPDGLPSHSHSRSSSGGRGGGGAGGNQGQQQQRGRNPLGMRSPHAAAGHNGGGGGDEDDEEEDGLSDSDEDLHGLTDAETFERQQRERQIQRAVAAATPGGTAAATGSAGAAAGGDAGGAGQAAGGPGAQLPASRSAAGVAGGRAGHITFLDPSTAAGAGGAGGGAGGSNAPPQQQMTPHHHAAAAAAPAGVLRNADAGGGVVSYLRPRAVVVDPHVRDLSFQLRPVAREDFLSPSLAIQANLTITRLLEAAHEEGVAIYESHMDLLAISGALDEDAAEDACACSRPGTWASFCAFRCAGALADPLGALTAACACCSGGGKQEAAELRRVRAWLGLPPDAAGGVGAPAAAAAAAARGAGGSGGSATGAGSGVLAASLGRADAASAGLRSRSGTSTSTTPGGMSAPASRTGSGGGGGGRDRAASVGASSVVLAAGSDGQVAVRVGTASKAEDAALAASLAGHLTARYSVNATERAPARGVLKRTRSRGSSVSGLSTGPAGAASSRAAAPLRSASAGAARRDGPASAPASAAASAKGGLSRAGSVSGAGKAGGLQGGAVNPLAAPASATAAGADAAVAAAADADGDGRSTATGYTGWTATTSQAKGEAGADGDAPSAGALVPESVPISEVEFNDRQTGMANSDQLLSLTLLLLADKVERVGTTQRRFGWLYVDYRPGAFWYEFWNTAKKGFLVGAAVALAERPGKLQCIVCVLILALYLLLHQYVSAIVEIKLMPPNSPEALVAENAQRAARGDGTGTAAAAAEADGPVTPGYLGQLQRRLMRYRGMLAMLQLDPSDPLRLGSAIPEAAITPDLPTAEVRKGRGMKVKFAGEEMREADVRRAAATVGEDGQVPDEDVQMAAASALGGDAGALKRLTYEDVLLLNPALLRPYHIACCNERARRLTRSTSRYACACPWWGYQLNRLPELLTTAWLDRVGVITQLLSLVLLFVYEAQLGAVGNVGTYQEGSPANSALLSWVMLLNAGVTLLIVFVICVDLTKELRLLGIRILSADACRRSSGPGGAKVNSSVEKAAYDALKNRERVLIEQLVAAERALGTVEGMGLNTKASRGGGGR